MANRYPITTDTTLIHTVVNANRQIAIIRQHQEGQALRQNGIIPKDEEYRTEPPGIDWDPDDEEAVQKNRPRLIDLAERHDEPCRIRVLVRPGENPNSPRQYFLADVPGTLVERDNPAIQYLCKLIRQWQGTLQQRDKGFAHMTDTLDILEGRVHDHIRFFLVEGFHPTDELDARCRCCVERGTPCVARAFSTEEERRGSNGQVFHHCLVCDISASNQRCDLRVLGPDTKRKAHSSAPQAQAETSRLRDDTVSLSRQAALQPESRTLYDRLVKQSSELTMASMDLHVKTPHRLSARDRQLQVQQRRAVDNLNRVNPHYELAAPLPQRGTLWPEQYFKPQHRLLAWYPLNWERDLSPRWMIRHGAFVDADAVSQVKNISAFVREAPRLPRWWVMERLQRYGNELGCRSMLVLDTSIEADEQGYDVMRVDTPGKRHTTASGAKQTRVRQDVDDALGVIAEQQERDYLERHERRERGRQQQQRQGQQQQPQQQRGVPPQPQQAQQRDAMANLVLLLQQEREQREQDRQQRGQEAAQRGGSNEAERRKEEKRANKEAKRAEKEKKKRKKEKEKRRLLGEKIEELEKQVKALQKTSTPAGNTGSQPASPKATPPAPPYTVPPKVQPVPGTPETPTPTAPRKGSGKRKQGGGKGLPTPPSTKKTKRTPGF